MSACSVGDLSSIPGLGRSLGEGNGNPLEYWRKFHGLRSLVGYSPWGSKESDMTEQLCYYMDERIEELMLSNCGAGEDS